MFASELSLSGSCLGGVLLDDHSEVDPSVVLSPDGVLVEPVLRANDQRKDRVELSGSRGIPHHE